MNVIIFTVRFSINSVIFVSFHAKYLQQIDVILTEKKIIIFSHEHTKLVVNLQKAPNMTWHVLP